MSQDGTGHAVPQAFTKREREKSTIITNTRVNGQVLLFTPKTKQARISFLTQIFPVRFGTNTEFNVTRPHLHTVTAKTQIVSDL